MFSHDKPPEFTFLLLAVAGNNRKEIFETSERSLFPQKKTHQEVNIKKNNWIFIT